MTKVYVDHISPRITYAFDFIFESRGLEYQFIEDRDQAECIYSQNCLASEPTVVMAAFMLSDKIEPLKPKVAELNSGLECFSFDEVFDPIASIFYTLSRYEEYTCLKTDEYGRFPLEQSHAPLSWLTKSMCDRWAEEVLKETGVDLSLVKNEGQFIPTFDIDNTYAYKLKTGKIKFGSMLKDALRRDKQRLQERKLVLSGEIPDPYDTFDTIRSVKRRFSQTKVFWLIGKRGAKDRNISIHNSEHQELIKSLSADGVEIGLHPSFGSFGSKSIVRREKETLEKICSTSITFSRQHYLRFKVNSTYPNLYTLGFQHEYSMGYAEHVGFRSGTARAHVWFDLRKNEITEFIVHPFAYMDGTLREYMKLSIEKSKIQIGELHHEVTRYGGDFVFIWHNETIGDYGNWKGWKDVLDFTLSLGNE